MNQLSFYGAQIVWGDKSGVERSDWIGLKQVHGTDVVYVENFKSVAAIEADALMTNASNVALGIKTADCAPVVLVADNGIVANAHAGWRGLVGGVIQNTVEQMRAHGAGKIRAALGPCIRAECYEFEQSLLDQLVDNFNPKVKGETLAGRPALNMVEGVKVACKQVDVALEFVHEACTACSGDYFSYRARKDEGRQVSLVWLL